ncbi:nucleoid-associated protein [Burkholderia gladioli]|nr:nucleoid-associated protein [Burkholderia gladioli]MDN7603918.1 nucleoid-associated protein [Burkholderia gladioli]
MLQLDLLSIERVIVHHINTRGPERTLIAPNYSNELVPLADGALDMFNERIVSSLGHNSKGIKADFTQTGQGSCFQKMARLMHCDDQDFIALSKELADDLTAAQLRLDLAPSKLLVATGRQGRHQRRFAVAVKAEMQDGFGETVQARRTVIQHLTKIFFTEAQRLFKIGFVQQNVGRASVRSGQYDATEFTVHLYDHMLTSTQTKGAAIYFYNQFLGADFAKSDKKLTQDFYEKTRKFFDSQELDAGDRMNLLDALRTELRSNEPTISVPDFGEKHMSAELLEEYEQFMRRANFPTYSITKDTEYISRKLRRRQRIVFSSGVTITAPPDQVQELITVDHEMDGTTVVTIQGTINSQE